MVHINYNNCDVPIKLLLTVHISIFNFGQNCSVLYINVIKPINKIVCKLIVMYCTYNAASIMNMDIAERGFNASRMNVVGYGSCCGNYHGDPTRRTKENIGSFLVICKVTDYDIFCLILVFRKR